MRARVFAAGAAVAVFGSVTSVGVAAQTISSPFEFVEHSQEAGPYVGYLSAETGRFGFGPSGGLLMGGRYAVQLSGPLALEGNLGFMSGDRDVVNPAIVVGDSVVGQADVSMTLIDARLRFSFVGDRTWHGFSPFITFGGGLVFDGAGSDPIEDTLDAADVFDFGTSFLGTVGLGTRWFLNERVAIRGDGVFSLWGIDTPPGFSDPLRSFENVEESEWMSGLSFSLTLVYRW